MIASVCKRHPTMARVYTDLGYRCQRCGVFVLAERSHRSKNNRSRGLAIQRDVLKQMGLQSLPGNGPVDGRSIGENGLHVAEVKSGGRFNETDWSDIVRLPNDRGQARWLVKAETPGPGHRRRVVVMTVLEDWQGLFVGAPA